MLETTRSLSRALRIPKDPAAIPQGLSWDPRFRSQQVMVPNANILALNWFCLSLYICYDFHRLSKF